MLNSYQRVSLPNIILILIIFISTSLYPQFDPELPKLIENRKKSCVSIETIRMQDDIRKVEPTKLGSGFIALKSGKIFVITNFHVVKAVRPDFHMLVGLNLKQGKIFNFASVIKVNPSLDIAVISLADSHYQRTEEVILSQQKIKVDQLAAGLSVFADSSDFLEGSSVLVIGFPLGLGTEVSGNEPVSRIGIIAQTVRSNGNFLIDGITSHGNSGSPIFNIQSGKLLGIVAGFPSDYISAYDENGQLIVKLPYNSGLSVCISSKEIWKMIP